MMNTRVRVASAKPSKNSAEHRLGHERAGGDPTRVRRARLSFLSFTYTSTETEGQDIKVEPSEIAEGAWFAPEEALLKPFLLRQDRAESVRRALISTEHGFGFRQRIRQPSG